jgi:hypothetical protein
MLAIGSLCVGADTDPRCHARRLVELLIAGLRPVAFYFTLLIRTPSRLGGELMQLTLSRRLVVGRRRVGAGSAASSARPGRVRRLGAGFVETDDLAAQLHCGDERSTAGTNGGLGRTWYRPRHSNTPGKLNAVART